MAYFEYTQCHCNQAGIGVASRRIIFEVIQVEWKKVKETKRRRRRRRKNKNDVGKRTKEEGMR